MYLSFLAKIRGIIWALQDMCLQPARTHFLTHKTAAEKYFNFISKTLLLFRSVFFMFLNQKKISFCFLYLIILQNVYMGLLAYIYIGPKYAFFGSKGSC
ncbi:hypothetical protein Emin_0663 [Elusimicrobium minutum Pei191]|uniref:Uncharacterized protein n=1 Tax=Elusimicrobium minutum (strain Pei191) TaxID=445932 RepID=B2KC91_ELUMP|nr:hypothetical protein Emin_0663 [Elusimicrobium minutum Pei191]